MFPPFLTHRSIQLVHFRAFGGFHGIDPLDITDCRRIFTEQPSGVRRAASALTAAAICRLIAPLTLPSQSEAISRQAECADPGIRLTVLYRKAETGKRLMGGAQAISILADVPITNLR